jgi:protein-S-isoprenylcysteine O-methyltransferase Ste14
MNERRGMLNLKAFAGLVFLLGVLSALLFIPAWTLHFWQAWVFLNSFTSATIEVARDQHVVSTGPYAVVRHPMYGGAVIMLAGLPIALGSWWALLAFPLMVLVVVARLIDEERRLIVELPSYAEYRDLVRYRLVPFIW